MLGYLFYISTNKEKTFQNKPILQAKLENWNPHFHMTKYEDPRSQVV